MIMLITQKAIRELILMLCLVSSAAMAANGYYTGARNNDAPVIPGGIYVPICNYSSDLSASSLTSWVFYFSPERGEWRQDVFSSWTASSRDESIWEDSSKVDSRMVLANRGCVGDKPTLYAVKMTDDLVFNVSGSHVGDACIIFEADDSLSGNQSEGANVYCDIYPGRPIFECHVTPSKTQWDLGELTAGELAEKKLNFVLDTKCDEPSIPTADVAITVTYNETDNVKMSMTDALARPVDGSYTLTQGIPFPIQIGFSGMPSKSGSVAYTAIMNITYL